MTAPVGSLATEAALLLDAVASRLRALGPDGTPASAARPVGAEVCPRCGHDPSSAVTCTGCPLCRFLAVVRGERPETTARLVEGALSVVQALRALLPEPAEGAGGEGTPESTGEGTPDGAGGEGTPDGAGVDRRAGTDRDPADRTPMAPPDPPARSAPGALERIVVR